MSYIEKEKLIKADIASIENRVRHAFNQGYDLGFKDGKEKTKPQEPRWIPVSERLPENMEYKEPTTENCESCRYHSSHHEVCNYCYKCSLWTEKEPTTKNDLADDCVSKADVLQILLDYDYANENALVLKDIKALLPVTPIRPKGHWIWEVDETPSTPISPYELNYAGWVCSCCHEFPDDICEWDNPDEPPTYKFCPNCGSDNREVEE